MGSRDLHTNIDLYGASIKAQRRPSRNHIDINHNFSQVKMTNKQTKKMLWSTCHPKSKSLTSYKPTCTTDDLTFFKMERTAALKNNKKKIERNRNGVMVWQQCHNHFTHLHSILKTSSCGQQWGDNWCQCQCSCIVREVTASSHACTVGLLLEKKKIFDYSNHLLTIKTWITDAYFFHMNI